MSEGNGMALVTGPTGAGKSTVLMAMLEAKPKGAVAHTIEDPIETLSTDPLVFQGNKKEGSYGDEVRDLMRMDPDIGQAGEIRDLKSLSEATGFARTGHLVLASLHAVSAIDAFSRMHDMGMSYNQLSEKNLFRLVSCQRLVPVLCPKCSKKVKSYGESLAMKRSVFRKQWEEWEKVATKESLERLKALAAESNLRVWNEKGCRHCHYTGIDGRQLLLEYVIIDKFARKCIREERWDEWRDSLQSRGWKSIQDQAWTFIESGSFCPNVANSKVSDLIINTDIERQYT
jgi:type II secretory ATPase GspE/PulE/Tfp pilus assembly ATPase PilB-like protein